MSPDRTPGPWRWPRAGSSAGGSPPADPPDQGRCRTHTRRRKSRAPRCRPLRAQGELPRCRPRPRALVERAMTATSPDRETLKRKSRAGMRSREAGFAQPSVFQFDVGRRDPQSGSEDMAQLPTGSDEPAAVPLQSQPLGAPTFLLVEASAYLADDVRLRIEHECQDFQTIILENRHHHDSRTSGQQPEPCVDPDRWER